MGVQKLCGDFEKLCGVLLFGGGLVGDWWGNRNYYRVFLWGLLDGGGMSICIE